MTLIAGADAARAGSLKARVMVLPAEGAATDSKLPADLSAALTAGARRVTPNVQKSTASLGDTAVIVGCDPADQACLESVAAALNVDQMLLVTVKSESGGDVTVEVTAISREAEPVTQQFVVRVATRKQDLAKIEAAVPGMLDAEAAAAEGGDGGDGGAVTGGGDGGTGSVTDPGLVGGTGPEPGPDPDRDRVSSTRAPMVVTIAGGAIAVLGLGAWTIAAVKQGSIDDAPTATAEDLERLEDMESSARTYASTGNGLVIGGAIAAIAGGIWWWKVSRADDAAPASGLVVSPMIGGDRGGLVLEGRW